MFKRFSVVLFAFIICVPADGGSLHDFEKAAGPGSSSPTSNKPLDESTKKLYERSECMRHHPDWTPEECENRTIKEQVSENLTGNLVFLFFGAVLASPFVVPKLLLHDDYSQTPLMKDRFRIGYSFQPIPGGTVGHRTDVLAHITPRFLFEGAYTHYRERIPGGADSLALGEVLVTGVFAQNEHLQLRTGLGYQALNGDDRHGRVKWVYRVKWLHAPLQINTDFGISWSSGKPLYEAAPALAWRYKQLEIGAGWRGEFVGSERIAGPELRLAVWF